MSIVRLTQVREYWTKNGEWPKHYLMKFMSFNRFTNIKKFFYIFFLVEGPLLMTRFFKKLEPIALIVRNNFQKVAIPAISISINEIIVQYIGQSKHTIMMRKKFCPVRYNVLALYEAGYCYSFIFSFSITGFFNLFNPTQQILEAEERKLFDNTIILMITS